MFQYILHYDKLLILLTLIKTHPSEGFTFFFANVVAPTSETTKSFNFAF